MLSLCLTNYNRYEMLLESFQHVYDDERISEIVISDDCSDIKIYNKLVEFSKDKPKIKLFRNDKNVGMGLNKKLAIERASNEWCILGDSDNVFKPDYIDAFYFYVSPDNPVRKSEVADLLDNSDIIYCPEFAMPQFDYRSISGQYITRENIKQFLKNKVAECFLNTCNYVVSRSSYLQVFKYNPAVKASDTIHFAYLWLKWGGTFFVVPNMKYFHRVGPHSGFLADVNYNMQQAEKTKRMIMQL